MMRRTGKWYECVLSEYDSKNENDWGIQRANCILMALPTDNYDLITNLNVNSLLLMCNENGGHVIEFIWRKAKTN